MPHDVTMPQLGMAQDAGKIVSWLVSPGDPVSKGDALFEVETDKAVMEVESPADGFLTGVRAEAGKDVPVGDLIARITESADDTAGDEEADQPAATGNGPGGDDLPDGHPVTMPQLGMAQDSGVLVAWVTALGEAVAVGDILFEVETDKSTMEVEADRDGWLAATLSQEGEEVPVGETVAIITAGKPANPVARPVRDGAAKDTIPPAPAAAETGKAPTRAEARTPKAALMAAPAGRILASPKARRLALEQGLDLGRLVEAGHAQPFHVADLEVLRALQAAAPAAASGGAPRRVIATCGADGLSDFVNWAAEAQGIAEDAVLAGLARASLGATEGVVVGVRRFDMMRVFNVPPVRALSEVAETDAAPVLILRDLRSTPLSSVTIGAEPVPVLTITDEGAGLKITLECDAETLDAEAAIRLARDFAGRVEQPLRHLL